MFCPSFVWFCRRGVIQGSAIPWLKKSTKPNRLFQSLNLLTLSFVVQGYIRQPWKTPPNHYAASGLDHTFTNQYADIMASLVAKVCVPDDFNHRVVQKVVLTDRYLVAGAFDGWITVLDVREAQQAEETDPIQYQRTLAADMWWDLDCRDDLIATANDNGNVTLWEAQTGYVERRFENPW